MIIIFGLFIQQLTNPDAYPPKSKMAESSLFVIFSVQISQEIIKLRKIGKRD